MCLDPGSARPSSGRVRFPSRAEDEEELLLEVSPFPEERLASSLASSLASPGAGTRTMVAAEPPNYSDGSPTDRNTRARSR